MTLGIDERVRAKANVFAREFDGEIVLLDLDGGVYYGLDGVATYAWKEMAAGRTIREVASAVLTKYDVDETRATSDILALVHDWVEKGLVEAV